MGPTAIQRAAPSTLGSPSIRPLRLGADRNALSVDLEDWYHVCNVEEYLPASQWDEYEERVTRNTRKILRLLEASGVRATFFILGYIAHRHPALVREVARAGHELGTHGTFHRRVFRMTPAEFREDLRNSIRAITDVVAAPVVGYRAPMWSIRRQTLWAIEILREEGILYDSSIAPITGLSGREFPAVPFQWVTSSGPLREFPLPSMRCFWEMLPYTGGLPMRLTPYWYILSKIRRANRAGHPAMVYVHPWEFDEAYPRAEIPLWSRFFQKLNLRATPPKVEGLLGELKFAPLGEVLEV